MVKDIGNEMDEDKVSISFYGLSIFLRLNSFSMLLFIMSQVIIFLVRFCDSFNA